MKLVISAGPATTGKTSVLRHVIKRLIGRGLKPAIRSVDAGIVHRRGRPFRLRLRAGLLEPGPDGRLSGRQSLDIRTHRQQGFEILA